jgi:hypothetical protein
MTKTPMVCLTILSQKLGRINFNVAEDYHTNDYPDEPAPDDEDDEYGLSYGNDEDEYSDNDEEGNPGRWMSWKRRTVPGDEEYDLDDSEEDDEPYLRKITREAWSLD